MRTYVLSMLIFMFLALPAYAQQNIAVNPNQDEPLEIIADQTLEWHRDDKRYIARGNVVATQGNVQIMADTLTADYRENKTKSMEIYRLTADGNVRIVSQGNTATGQNAVYEVDQGIATMTGDNLSLSSPDQVVMARDRFEYNVTQGQLRAIGGMKAIRGEDTLEADEGFAAFTEDAQGKRQLKKMEAIGNVVITTPTEVLRGQRGIYLASTNTAELLGNVTISRGPNILEGERAEVNLATNVSKMHGSAIQSGDSSGRVRGVFYPGSEGAAGEGIQEVQPNVQQPVQERPDQQTPRGMLTR